MNGHEQMRRKLCDAAVAYVESSNSTRQALIDEWADKALAEFDARFKPTSTDEGWQPVETIPTSGERIILWWHNYIGSTIPDKRWDSEFAKSKGITHWRRIDPPKEAAK